MLEAFYFGAAVVTVGGALLWPVRTLIRRRAQRRRHAADRSRELRSIAAEFAGATLSAHARVATLGRLGASWVPISQGTALKLGEPLLDEAGPIAALRGRIHRLGGEETNRAADEILHVLERSAELLTESKFELRRVDWSGRETDLAQALDVFNGTVH